MTNDELDVIKSHTDDLSLYLSCYDYACSSYEKQDDPEEAALELAEAARVVLEDISVVLDEVEQLRALHEPFPDTYSCAKCGRRDGLDCVIPNQLWNQIEAEKGYGVLCAWCLDDELVARGIETRALLAFAGRAISGGTAPLDNDDVHWEVHLEQQTGEYHRLWEEAEQLRTVLREFMCEVIIYEPYDGGVGHCCVCDHESDHEEDCVVVRARALLGEEIPMGKPISWEEACVYCDAVAADIEARIEAGAVEEARYWAFLDEDDIN